MKNLPRFLPSLTVKEIITALPALRASQKNWLKEFSERFADFIGVAYAVPAPSGRGALAGILFGLQFPKKSEVILPSLIFHSLPEILQEFGLRPRFVDINPDTYCMDIRHLEKSINSSTVAIVPVHLYGRACNMDVIMAVANRHKLAVIEDCAQACGGFYSGRRLGSFGSAAIFSFHPHKNISVLGSGMLVTNSKEIADRAVFWFKNFPLLKKTSSFKHLFYAASMHFGTKPCFWDNLFFPILKIGNSLGVDLINLLTYEPPDPKKNLKPNWFMPGQIHGRIGLSQLCKLDSLNQQRINNGNKLLKKIKNIPQIKSISLAPYGENIYSTFVVRVKNKKNFRSKIGKLGIDTHGGNMLAGSQLPGFEGASGCKVAADVNEDIVHLPVYSKMGDSEISRIAECITNVLSDQKI